VDFEYMHSAEYVIFC